MKILKKAIKKAQIICGDLIHNIHNLSTHYNNPQIIKKSFNYLKNYKKSK